MSGVRPTTSTQSDGSEFGWLDGYEHVLISDALAAPTSARTMVQLDLVSLGKPLPVANGSSAVTAMVHEVAGAPTCVWGLLHRSGLLSPQVKTRVAGATWTEGVPPAVLQTAKLALPSASVSMSAQPSRVVPPGDPASSQFRVTAMAVGTRELGTTRT